MAINSNLSCDGTNTEQAYLKLINNKFCVVCQSNVCACLDLSTLFIPVDQWTSISVLLKPNEIKEIDTLISSKGPRIEIQRVDVSNIFIETLTSIQLNVSNSLIDEDLDVSLTDVEDIDDLVTAISDELKLNDTLYPLIEVFAFGDSYLQIQTKEQGDSYTYVLTDSSSPSFTYVFSIYQASERYDHNRLKLIILQAFYDEDKGSNEKHIQYSYNLDHVAEPVTWHNMGKLLIHSTDDDVLDTDENLIETIWLQNPLSYTVKVTGMVAV